jgi:hypothetical protein
VLLVSLMALGAWFLPDSVRSELWQVYRDGESAAAEGVLALLYAAVVLALEPFYVASGFAMYLNRRVELEAWDIEQEFRHVF